MSNNDYYEEEDIPEIENFNKVYQLRHFSNIYGHECISEYLNIPIGRVYSIYHSLIHGSKDLKPLLKEDYKKTLNKYKKEEKERQKSILNVEKKKEELICNLEEKRKDFATIGTNKAKRRLNKLIKKDNNIIAEVLRIALEIEDKNIIDKKT